MTKTIKKKTTAKKTAKKTAKPRRTYEQVLLDANRKEVTRLSEALAKSQEELANTKTQVSSWIRTVRELQQDVDARNRLSEQTGHTIHELKLRVARKNRALEDLEQFALELKYSTPAVARLILGTVELDRQFDAAMSELATQRQSFLIKPPTPTPADTASFEKAILENLADAALKDMQEAEDKEVLDAVNKAVQA